jgi:RHH-type transcriptional regulator, proline utilization regulon repressor / proline dehydrogenase / delta 1-pyrroline-5-carboxylate dehydrogenase
MPPFARFAPIPAPLAPQRAALRGAIRAATRQSEEQCLPPLLARARVTATQQAAIRATATGLVAGLRARGDTSGVAGLMREYALSSTEGVALMCLAEALLRIPDEATRDALIRDKIAHGDWRGHLGGGSGSLFVNAATWGLVFAGALTRPADDGGLGAALTRLIARCGEPVIRAAMVRAIRLMGGQFVTGETIEDALDRARDREAKGFAFSYDMLGEAAMTAQDASHYFKAYADAIEAIGRAAAGRGVVASPSVSIKLSALHPRYARAQGRRVMEELLPRLTALCAMARRHDIGLSIDAEEADRLDLSLDLFEALALDPALADWHGLGFVVQAYGKRAPLVVDWIVALARASGRRIMLRLVKGAYWDSEIKKAQIDGLADYPVYTRKVHTDVAYIACARAMLAARDAIFPQFATHNAQTVATIHHLAGEAFTPGDYEFQCLQGMGEPLYEQVVGAQGLGRPCRIYAPVGTHETLLAYLVRRLLENGANSSFVHRLADASIPPEVLVGDPVEEAGRIIPPGRMHDAIALPGAILGGRVNSAGLDLSDETVLAALAPAMEQGATLRWQAGLGENPGEAVTNPARRADVVGTAHATSAQALPIHAQQAREALAGWTALGAAARGACLTRAADAFEADMPRLMGLIIREAGKSAASAVAELREAVDFLRYYAQEALSLPPQAQPLGVVACISPWNFPLAIFVGQLCAALAAGNTVLAKPAEETPLIAAEAVRVLHQAGVPQGALHLLVGDGTLGAALVALPQVAGVMFTGSTQVARAIQHQLAERVDDQGHPIPLIAETGGMNAMIVDSSALPEQVVADCLASAFDSAGQRCSALRILCVQEEIAERLITMLKGAMDELTLGSPDVLAHDIGPVISPQARRGIENHVARMAERGHPVHRLALPAQAQDGDFVAPTLIGINRIGDVEQEVFGPVLHILRWRRDGLDRLLADIDATGYGLTFGLHSRIGETVEHVCGAVRAGNLYVNRNMIGAVVGVQPFGGRGLSGTGPKAGGPLYLTRLVRGAAAVAAGDAGARDTGAGDTGAGDTGAGDAGALALADWLAGQGDADLAQEIRADARTSPLGRHAALPGPVGEANHYALHPRGEILCLPTTPQGQWRQIGAALATGNGAAVLGGFAKGLPATVAGRVRWISGFAEAAGCAAALIQGDAQRIIAAQQALSQMEGAIIPLHAAPYPLALLVEEVVRSTNTAAAGGNAALMTI